MHPRVIIHIDIDCFYAQVEEIQDPTLRKHPMGIQQKNFLVTSNYRAREFGITKLMAIPDAMKLCPDLVMVNGEDLTKYKKMSDQIHAVMLGFSSTVEKLGLDENYLDVTEMVSKRLADGMEENKGSLEPETFVFSIDDTGNIDTECDCGCLERLKIGTWIAKEIRNALFSTLGITSCAGIGHNKLLAKLIGSHNKPNKQTVIFPEATNDFMLSLDSVKCLIGIGMKMSENLDTLGIRTVEALQRADLSMLQKKFDHKTCDRLKNLAFGIDKSEVKPSGKPKTISIEDSTHLNPLKTILEVETKFSIILSRLVDGLLDDGRIPSALRITVRKSDPSKEFWGQRESRQKDIPSSWFKAKSNHGTLTILLHTVAMTLFRQLVDVDRDFRLTLLGVAATKFNEIVSGCDTKGGLMKFLVPVSKSSESVVKLNGEPISEKVPQTSESQIKLHDNDEVEGDAREPPGKKIKLETNCCLEKSSIPIEAPLKQTTNSIPSIFNAQSMPKKDKSPQKIQEKTKKVLIYDDIELPRDLDPKQFNKLPIRIKHRIMSELQKAIKNQSDTSNIDYPRKEEVKLSKNKLDGFVFKY